VSRAHPLQNAGPPISTATTRSSAPLGPIGLVALGLVAQEIGASIAVLVFPTVGPIGMVALRLGFSAIILMAAIRPRLRGLTRRQWMTAALFGLAIAAMNASFYIALERLPLGPTVTIEVLGPLVLSVVVARRASAWLWAVLAFVGVALLGWGETGGLDPVGVLFALGAAVLWAAYILLSERTGAAFRGLDGLAIAMSIGAVVVLPFGIASGGHDFFRWDILLLGAAVALASSAIPYGLELLALRRLAASVFSILMSLAPAIAALAGFVLLGQQLGVLQIVAIGIVIAASIGAVRSARRSDAARGDETAEPLA
jgi:inner membrane transporter RhtA